MLQRLAEAAQHQQAIVVAAQLAREGLEHAYVEIARALQARPARAEAGVGIGVARGEFDFDLARQRLDRGGFVVQEPGAEFVGGRLGVIGEQAGDALK